MKIALLRFRIPYHWFEGMLDIPDTISLRVYGAHIRLNHQKSFERFMSTFRKSKRGQGRPQRRRLPPVRFKFIEQTSG